MSFFAVLDAQDGASRGRFTVDELHVNVWSLASLIPGQRSLVVDVGVKITATAKKPVDELTLAVPFRVLASKDLSEQLTDNKTAALIFDAVAWYNPTSSLLTVDGSSMQLLRMDARSEKDTALTSETLTVWNVAFVRALKRGETGYYRMRFEVAPGRAWEWQPSGFFRIRNGLLVDLRVSDVRSTLELAAGESILSRVLEIKKAYLFAVLPQSLSPSNVSPEPNYIRLLEPRVWGRYLDRKAEFSGRRLVVHQWKSEKGAKGEPIPLTTDKPMRLYGRFDLRTRFAALRGAILTGALLFALVATLLNVPFKPEVIAGVESVSEWFRAFWTIVLLPLGAIGLATFAISSFKWLRGVKDLLARFETFVFKKLFRPES